MTRLQFAFLPILLLSAGFAISFRFKLDPVRHTIMMAEMERLREGGSRAEASDEAKTVCEVLSGMKDEDCFRVLA